MGNYDITFAKGDDTYGFMLLRQGREKAWKVTDAPLLPPALITNEALPANISPEREIQINQDDWRGGFSQLVFEHEKKYYLTENCDGRFKIGIILSPKQNTSIPFA